MRTTVDIDDPILADLKRLQQREGKSLGRMVSDLLAQALRDKRHRAAKPAAFAWTTRAMNARVDLSDRDALLDSIDEPRR
jgi:hypothetical protein